VRCGRSAAWRRVRGIWCCMCYGVQRSRRGVVRCGTQCGGAFPKVVGWVKLALDFAFAAS
ncbi:hypothetical protein, partial [Gordoniibacillus kamchatkensis]|uniref:hypothetical protein n=1 Tax=Gordoniibacillus kamchatkensis TaxID=1590651 RepID=UPI001E614562